MSYDSDFNDVVRRRCKGAVGWGCDNIFCADCATSGSKGAATKKDIYCVECDMPKDSDSDESSSKKDTGKIQAASKSGKGDSDSGEAPEEKRQRQKGAAKVSLDKGNGKIPLAAESGKGDGGEAPKGKRQLHIGVGKVAVSGPADEDQDSSSDKDTGKLQAASKSGKGGEAPKEKRQRRQKGVGKVSGPAEVELEGEDADDEMADQEANVDGNQSNSTASAFLGFLNNKYRGKVPKSASIVLHLLIFHIILCRFREPTLRRRRFCAEIYFSKHCWRRLRRAQWLVTPHSNTTSARRDVFKLTKKFKSTTDDSDSRRR
jgi:hypothetical protein